MAQSVEHIIDEIFELYCRFGNADYIGEPVSQIEHMSQSAQLAIDSGADDEVVLAAFFHDIGHLCESKSKENDMAGFGIKSHEAIGARFLREKGFPERVAHLVESHVQAKRYLAYKNPAYLASLSEASKKTLEYQGGQMQKDEAAHFEKVRDFKIIIQLRLWDEAAKTISEPIIDLELIKQKAAKVLSSNQSRFPSQ